jgi:hypothetical protein
MAIRRDGSFYLTYHRHATRAQLEACYPRFREFLRLKHAYDPQEQFQSDWYRHYRERLADAVEPSTRFMQIDSARVFRCDPSVSET